MSNLQVRLVSSLNTLTYLIDDKTAPGKTLNAKIKVNKIGGLVSFSFDVDRKSNIPLASNIRVQFWYKNVLKFTGFTTNVPYFGSNEEILTVEGVGYWKRLEEKKVSLTFAASTVGAIIAALSLTNTDVVYNAAKISAPATVIANIEFNSKSLAEVLQTLVNLSNTAYNTTQYVCYVDETREIVFTPLSSVPVDAFFEGYDFQAPEVDFQDSVINRVLVYKALTGSGQSTTFVDAYEDTASQSRYGIKEKVLTFPDFYDNTTAQAIANSYLTKYKEPLRSVKLTLVRDNFLLPSFYSISIKKELYQFLVNDCEQVSDWSVLRAPNFALSIVTTLASSGRSALRVVITAPAVEQYVEYVLPNPVKSPKSIRFRIYFLTSVGDVRLQFIDSKDSLVEVLVDSTNNALAGDWLTYTKKVSAELTTKVLEVDPTSGTAYLVGIDQGAGVTVVLGLTSGNVDFLEDITKIRLISKDGLARTIYIDRIDCEAISWIYNKLTLESVEYEIEGSKMIAKAEFGQVSTNLVDEIIDGDSYGDVAYAIFSKG